MANNFKSCLSVTMKLQIKKNCFAWVTPHVKHCSPIFYIMDIQHTHLLKQQFSIPIWSHVHKPEPVYGLIWIPVCKWYIICSLIICINQNDRKWITYLYILYHPQCSFHNGHPNSEKSNAPSFNSNFTFHWDLLKF